MARLPAPGGDEGQWGEILNDFLSQEHAGDGTHGVINTEDIISKGPWMDVRVFGAKGDGATDDTQAIQAALDTGKNVIIPQGTYLTSEKLVQRTTDQSVLAFGARIHVVNADKDGWQVGHDEENRANCNLLGLRIEYKGSSQSTGTGVILKGLQYSTIQIQDVRGFQTQVKLTSGSVGCVHNKIFLGHLYTNNKENGIGLHVAAQDGLDGYVNENTFYGGNFAGSSKYMVYVQKTSGKNGLPTNNAFFRTAFHGDKVRAFRDEGRSTMILWPWTETKATSGELCSLSAPDFEWIKSSKGVNEYYVQKTPSETPSNGGDENPFPDGVVIRSSSIVRKNGEDLAWGRIGALGPGQFGWGDNDNLGFSTLYVRFTTSEDPSNATIEYLDQNDIHIAPGAKNSTVRVSHYALQGVTCEGEYSDIRTRDTIRKEFQNASNTQTFEMKRVGANNLGNVPAFRLGDTNSGGKSQVLELFLGNKSHDAFAIRAVDMDREEQFRITADGIGRFKGGLGIGNSEEGNVTGTIPTKKIQVFDHEGNPLGYIQLYQG